jgi:hypothetical protein
MLSCKSYVALLAGMLVSWQAMADPEVYDPNQPTLNETNKKVFKPLTMKPYKESYQFVKNISDDKWFFADLRKACNMGFQASRKHPAWTGERSEQFDLYPFSPGYGKQKLYGVLFDIIDPDKNDHKGMITMKSGWRSSETFPDFVSFPVNKKISRFYFLHGGSWADTQWGMGAVRRYEVIYADGSKSRIPIICAGGHENIGNWFWSPSSGVPLMDTDTAKPVPVETELRNYIIYTFEWVNPNPDKMIKQINIVTRDDDKWFTVVVLAISGVLYEGK